MDIATVTLSTLLGRIEQLESLVQELVKFTNYSQNTTIPPSPQQSCYLGNISQTNNETFSKDETEVQQFKGTIMKESTEIKVFDDEIIIKPEIGQGNNFYYQDGNMLDDDDADNAEEEILGLNYHSTPTSQVKVKQSQSKSRIPASYSQNPPSIPVLIKPKTHECFQCGKFFAKQCNLQEHIKIHANPLVEAVPVLNLPKSALTHGCSLCGKFFSKNYYLKQHIKNVHANLLVESVPVLNLPKSAMQFGPCSQCGKFFAKNHYLKQHFKKFHANLPTIFHCTEAGCDAKFGLNSQLTKHTKKVHLDKPWSCSKCGQNFPRENMLKIHEEFQHTDDLNDVHVEQVDVDVDIKPSNSNEEIEWC